LMLGKEQNKGQIRMDAEAIVKKMIEVIPPILHDLLEIATYVYVGDQIVSRGGRQFQYGYKWHRKLFFKIPVCEYDTWSDPAIQNKLETCLSFVAGETYRFEFFPQSERQRPDFLNFKGIMGNENTFERVVCFSGGLDSFAGALEEVIINKKNVCLVSHYSNGKILNHQKELHKFICETQRGLFEPLHVPIQINKDKRLSREKTQRARSFLFATLGAVIAYFEKLSEVYLYENGVVSCNLSWDGQTYQAKATRSTHPKFLFQLSDLFSELMGYNFTFKNPYLTKTKSEVVERLVTLKHHVYIPSTRSCAESVYQNPYTHCGTCSQCIDRRFATLSANCLDYDPWHIYRTNIYIDSLENIYDRTMVSQFAGFARRIEGMSKEGFVYSYASEIQDIIPFAGENREHAAEVIYDLHRRHARQVNGVLEEMIGEYTSELRQGNLPRTCLLHMILEKSLFGSTQDILILPLGNQPVFLSVEQIAEHFVLNEEGKEAARKRLERERKNNFLDSSFFIEDSNRGRGNPQFLYNLEKAKEILSDLISPL